MPSEVGSRQSAVGSRQSAVGSRQSADGIESEEVNQPALDNQQSAIPRPSEDPLPQPAGGSHGRAVCPAGGSTSGSTSRALPSLPVRPRSVTTAIESWAADGSNRPDRGEMHTPIRHTNPNAQAEGRLFSHPRLRFGLVRAHVKSGLVPRDQAEVEPQHPDHQREDDRQADVGQHGLHCFVGRFAADALVGQTARSVRRRAREWAGN